MPDVRVWKPRIGLRMNDFVFVIDHDEATSLPPLQPKLEAVLRVGDEGAELQVTFHLTVDEVRISEGRMLTTVPIYDIATVTQKRPEGKEENVPVSGDRIIYLTRRFASLVQAGYENPARDTVPGDANEITERLEGEKQC